MIQAEIGCPGGFGRAWASSMARLLRDNPARGISQNLHHLVVWRNRVEIGPLNLSKFSVDGKRTDYEMPQIASGWKQFVRFAEKAGLSTAEARA